MAIKGIYLDFGQYPTAVSPGTGSAGSGNPPNLHTSPNIQPHVVILYNTTSCSCLWTHADLNPIPTMSKRAKQIS